MEKLKKYEWPIFLIFINIFILIFLKTSPIYNGITIGEGDHNLYHVIAKEMLNGKILYKNIFDIKGPFIFFIYYIANIFKNPNLMYFIIDTLMLNLIFILNKKTINLKSNNIICYTFTIIQMFFILFCFKIVCPETFMLLTISYLNYWILSKQYLKPTKTQLIICGILTGLIFWIKFSLGVYIALIYFYFIFTHIKNKTFNYKYVLMPLVGFLIPTAIVFGYFIYNNALYDLINNYFLISAKYKNSFNTIPYTPLLLLLINVILLIKSKNKRTILILLISYCTLTFTTFFISKMNFQYYYVPFISMVPLITNIIDLNKRKQIFKYINFSLIILLIFSLTTWNINTNSFNESSKLIKNDLKEYENIAFLFHSDPIILTELDKINYKYPFTPNLTYEQYPEMWDDIYKNTANKNIEYLILMESYDTYTYANIISESEKTKEIIDKIYLEIKENYTKEKSYISSIDNVEFVLYKRK